MALTSSPTPQRYDDRRTVWAQASTATAHTDDRTDADSDAAERPRYRVMDDLNRRVEPIDRVYATRIPLLRRGYSPVQPIRRFGESASEPVVRVNASAYPSAPTAGASMEESVRYRRSGSMSATTVMPRTISAVPT